MNAPRAVPLVHAIGWVLLAGVLAQFAGALVAGVVNTAVAGAGGGAGGVRVAALLPSMAASTATLIAIALLAPRVAGAPVREALGLRSAPPLAYAAAAVGCVALGPVADVAMRGIAALAPDATLGVLEMLHDVVASTPALLIWPFFALMPGLSEELLFRGLLQRAAGRGVAAITISAVGFALFHVDPHHVVGVLPLGFFLAWVASRVGTLVTIFAHVVNNTVAIVSVHVEALDVGYGTDAPMPLTWAPIGLALCGLCVWAIARAQRADSGAAGG